MARPFYIPENGPQDPRYQVIENLLRELLAKLRELMDLLRWSSYFGTNIQETLHILNHDIYNSRLFDEEHNRLAAEEFTRQHNIRLRELRQRQQQQRQQQQQPQQQPQPQPQPQPQQQQQQPLPDLVQSAEVTEARRKPAEDGRLKPITLQVEVCPKCYENGKLKVISVTNPLANNGDIAQQINRTVEHQSHHNHDDEPPVVVEDKSKIKKLLSMFQPSRIDKSVITAMVVIIGWKIFVNK